MYELSFQHGDARVTVRTARGFDSADGRFVVQKVIGALMVEGVTQVDTREMNRIGLFASSVTQSSVEGDLPFVWPGVAADGAMLLAAYRAWGASDDALVTTWLYHLDLVNNAPGDPDLAPLIDALKKTTLTPTPS